MRGSVHPTEELATDERWLLVNRVASSARFEKSLKLREFLLYIAEHALRGQTEMVRAQQIGVQVFGRRPDYNVSEDSIVRVEARELRIRLKAYFEAEGKNEQVVIVVQKGGYLPAFVARESATVLLTVDLPALSPAPSAPWRMRGVLGALAVFVLGSR